MESRVDYRDYLPQNSTRERENVEWVQFYSFNAADENAPRVLSIGDSICCQYQDFLREKLGTKVNLTSWGTCKCVTDPVYLKELEHVLEFNRYDLILFNNGLHSLVTPPEEWEKAYGRTLDFIVAKLPAVPVMLLLCTPLDNEEKTEIAKKLNEITLLTAEKRNLPVVDLFTPMDKLDREKYWSDEYHFREPAKIMQAEILASHVEKCLQEKIAASDGKLFQKSSDTGPFGRIL
ncbi:MAG: SGNH/GDSL hydrolase family protein [Lentisphaeria bacterium]|nr:SGNH/GDSL hydrolase family protein [Lentisphaeria bacterium]